MEMTTQHMVLDLAGFRWVLGSLKSFRPHSGWVRELRRRPNGSQSEGSMETGVGRTDEKLRRRSNGSQSEWSMETDVGWTDDARQLLRMTCQRSGFVGAQLRLAEGEDVS